MYSSYQTVIQTVNHKLGFTASMLIIRRQSSSHSQNTIGIGSPTTSTFIARNVVDMAGMTLAEDDDAQRLYTASCTSDFSRGIHRHFPGHGCAIDIANGGKWPTPMQNGGEVGSIQCLSVGPEPRLCHHRPSCRLSSLPRHRRFRRAVRSRTSRRARRRRATAARKPVASVGICIITRLTWVPCSGRSSALMPCHQPRTRVTRHHEQPADRQVHGQPSAVRRHSRDIMQRSRRSATCRSPLALSAAMTRSCISIIPAISQRVVICVVAAPAQEIAAVYDEAPLRRSTSVGGRGGGDTSALPLSSLETEPPSPPHLSLYASHEFPSAHRRSPCRCAYLCGGNS